MKIFHFQVCLMFFYETNFIINNFIYSIYSTPILPKNKRKIRKKMKMFQIFSSFNIYLPYFLINLVKLLCFSFATAANLKKYIIYFRKTVNFNGCFCIQILHKDFEFTFLKYSESASLYGC